MKLVAEAGGDAQSKVADALQWNFFSTEIRPVDVDINTDGEEIYECKRCVVGWKVRLGTNRHGVTGVEIEVPKLSVEYAQLDLASDRELPPVKVDFPPESIQLENVSGLPMYPEEVQVDLDNKVALVVFRTNS